MYSYFQKNSLLFAFIINQYSLRSLDFRDFQFMLIYAVCHKQILLKLSKHSLSTFCHRPSFLNTFCAEHYPGGMDNGIGVFFFGKRAACETQNLTVIFSFEFLVVKVWEEGPWGALSDCLGSFLRSDTSLSGLVWAGSVSMPSCLSVLYVRTVLANSRGCCFQQKIGHRRDNLARCQGICCTNNGGSGRRQCQIRVRFESRVKTKFLEPLNQILKLKF